MDARALAKGWARAFLARGGKTSPHESCCVKLARICTCTNTVWQGM